MSTTINSYSVALGLNASGLIDGSRLARNEARSLQRTFDQLIDPVERVNSKLDLLEKAVREGAIHETTAAEVKRRLTGTLQDNTAAVNANAEALRRDNALIAEGERLTRSMMTAEERHAQEIRRVNQLRQSQAIGETTYRRAVAAANGRLADSRIVTAQVVRTPPKVSGAIGTAVPPTPAVPAIRNQGIAATGASALGSRLTNLAAGYIGVYSAANFASGAIRKSASIEKAAAAYEVLTGSAQQAKDILSGVRDIASKGISLTALNQSAQVMLSSNVAAQTILPTLRQISEITGGDTERMQRMSLAFSQVAGNGRLMGQELNQMVEAGFNPLVEISRTTGRSMIDLRKDMADGAISFEMVKDAFESVTSEGGRFNGMLDKINETTAGALNSAKATFEAFQISVGDALGPAIQALAADFKDSASSGSELVGIVRELSQGLADFEGGIKGISGKGIIGTVSSGLGFTQALGSQVRSVLTNPFSIGKDIGSGDFGAAREKLFGKIDAFLDGSNGAAVANSQTPTVPATEPQTIDAEPHRDLKYYDGLEATIKRAQVAGAASLDTMRQAADAEEERNKRIEEGQRLETEANRIKERFTSDAERLAKSMADIDRLQSVGLIGQFEAQRARDEALKGAVKDVKIEAPKNLEVGSQEAYKFFADSANREQQKAITAAAKANTEKEVAAINGVKVAVEQVASNLKRKR